MPVPQQRDPALTRERLAGWVAARWPGARIGDVRVPANGYSNETLTFDVHTAEGTVEPVVARVEADGHRVLPHPRLAEQARVMSVLRATDVPVPRVHGFEADPSVLGAPFMVMERVAGLVPPDFPSYHRAGWVAELSPGARARLWWSGVEALHRVHRVDHGLVRFAGRHPAGSPDPGTRLAYWTRHVSHFGVRSPVVAAALDWLRGHLPPVRRAPVLQWGDARLGNLVYDGGRPVAVLDWEMLGLGPPEADLAWFLHLDRFLSEGLGLPRLPGLPGRDETVARYQKLAGHAVSDLCFHEVFAATLFALITARVTRLSIAQGLVPEGFPLHDNAVRLLKAALGAAVQQDFSES
jgi:aminoglycoside phosphotransferase (APT) family kinase protein